MRAPEVVAHEIFELHTERRQLRRSSPPFWFSGQRLSFVLARCTAGGAIFLYASWACNPGAAPGVTSGGGLTAVEIHGPSTRVRREFVQALACTRALPPTTGG